MLKITTIGDVSISAEWENNRVILTLDNHGQNEESIEVRYQESRHRSTKPLAPFKQLSPDESHRIQLSERLEHWEKLHFDVGQNTRRSVSITDLIAALKKSCNEVESPKKSEPLPRDSEPLSPKLEQSMDSEKSPYLSSFQATEEQQSDPLATLGEMLTEVRRKNKTNEQLHTAPEQQKNSALRDKKPPRELKHKIQNQQENIIPNPQNKITQLEQTAAERQKEIDDLKNRNAELVQENSELKRELDTQTEAMPSDPEQVFREAAHRVLQTLFEQHQKEVGEISQDPMQICQEIEMEIKRFEAQFDGAMIYTLSVVKEYLTKVKGLIHFELSELSSPQNQPEQLAQLVLMDEPPDEVQFPYLGELGKVYWNNLKAFTKKLPHVIVEAQALLHRIVIQLLDGFSPYYAKTAKEEQTSRCFYEEYLPNILQTMSLELVPIEIGQTEADSRIHDIQGSQRGAYRRGVVADIIQYGVRRIADKQIIRKPVVMRGEPE